MTAKFDDYQHLLAQSSSAMRKGLQHFAADAKYRLSPSGFDDYLKGAHALMALRRGDELVMCYLKTMLPVATYCGEAAIRDCTAMTIKLAALTSGSVLTLMLASLPKAAHCLDNSVCLRDYLNLIYHLASHARQGLQPMLMHSDELLTKLNLSGLQHWVNVGIRAYQHDSTHLIAYFNLTSSDSRALLQKERRGVLWVNAQRPLHWYLRALWGRDFVLRSFDAYQQPVIRPYSEAGVFCFPDALEGNDATAGLTLYRAMAAHLAAHDCYSQQALVGDGLSAEQMFFIGLVEDARVEYKAVLVFPGLKALWRSFMPVDDIPPTEPSALALVERVVLMLLDVGITSADTELNRFAAKFHDQISEHQDNTHFSWHMGLDLFRLFARRNRLPSVAILASYRIAYRDDNRFVWLGSELDGAEREVLIDASAERDAELKANEVTEKSPEPACGNAALSGAYRYAEWDYQLQQYQPDWVTLYEHDQPKGDIDIISAILMEYKPVVQRIKQLIAVLSPSAMLRKRNREEGDEIDINAAVDAMVALRMGEDPSPRITLQNVLKRRDLAVLVLLDVSESTNKVMQGADKTVLQLTLEAATLLSVAIDGIGDCFAVHGFASDGRHDVQYCRFKDFNQGFDDEARARLAGMRGGLSTRMGAALRHAGDHLLRQQARRKLILLVTDGEPADIDERDPQYLRQDAKKAVEGLYGQGVLSYCLTLDPHADGYVKRIFGGNNYTVIDRIDRLPERLPLLFARLTR